MRTSPFGCNPRLKDSTVKTWNEIRSNRPVISWWKLVWFPLTIPKHAFINHWLLYIQRIGWSLMNMIGSCNEATKGITFVCSAGSSWKIGITCSLHVPSVVESGRSL